MASEARISTLVLAGLVLALILPMILAPKVRAHAFGAPIEVLPAPPELYWLGGALVVLLTFLLLAFFLREGVGIYPRLRLFRFNMSGKLGIVVSLLIYTLKAVFLLFLVLLIVAGILGSPRSADNIAPLIVWVAGFVGLTILHAIIGNLWSLVNPWVTLYELIFPRSRGKALLEYPKRLGIWPAFILLLIFAWIELAYPGSASPRDLGLLALIYTIINLVGMRLFGPSAWIGNCEFLSIYFRYVSSISPFEVSMASNDKPMHSTGREEVIISWKSWKNLDIEIYLRPPALGTLGFGGLGVSSTAFILLMLSSVSFDGFSRTLLWYSMLGLRPFPTPSRDEMIPYTTAGLLIGFIAFASIYTLTMILTWFIAIRRGLGSYKLIDLVEGFAATLIPIAFVYYIAHYMVFLQINIQYFIKHLSDPMGFGWNIFGTKNYSPNLYIDHFTVWHTQVALIVGGHILAVYASHIKALKMFKPSKSSELILALSPLTILMIFYTVFGLWLISAPGAG